MLRKIKAKELKVGDVFAREEYLYPHVVTRIGGISGYDRLMRISFDWINKFDGCHYEDCVEVLGEETEIYRYII